MKKILFLHPTLNTGGAEKMLCEIVERLDPLGFEKSVVCLYGPGPIGDRLSLEGFGVHTNVMRNKYDIIGAFRLFSLIRNQRPDVLWLADTPLTLFWGSLFGRMTGVPFIFTVIQGMRKPSKKDDFISGIVEGLVLKRLDMVACVSKAKLEPMLKRYSMDKDKTVLLYNSVDIERFKDMQAVDSVRKKIGIPDGAKIIGMVGRLVPGKGYGIFLKSARDILKKHANTRFLIIGAGNERCNLDDMARNLNIEKEVMFLGERQDIPELVALFDVAALCSKANSTESCSIALLEYMAASRPIVATDAGGNAELVIDQESGLIVPSDNPEEFAKAVVELLEDPKKACSLGRAARKRAEEMFSSAAAIKRIEKLLQDGLDSSQRHKMQRDKGVHIIMAGPGLSAKGGISGFANYYLRSDLSKRFGIIYHVTTVDGPYPRKLMFFAKSLALFIVRLVSDPRIKIVHACSSSGGSFYRKAAILGIAKVFGKKTVFHIHSSGFFRKTHPVRRYLIRKILDASDSVLILSGAWLYETRKATSNKNIRIIPNPVDTAKFRPMVANRQYRGLNVLFVGQLTREKGVYDILEIAPEVKKAFPGVRLFFAGDGDVRDIKAACRKNRIEDIVVLSGWLGKRALVKAFEDASVFLLPSHRECFPISVLEAMASGLPVISTRTGGIPDMIQDGVNGFLVEPGNQAELKSALMAMLGDCELRTVMGKKNAKKAGSEFSLDIVADKFYAEYKRLLSRKEEGRGRIRLAGKAAWYLKRLSCMSFPEVAYRTGKYIFLSMDRFYSSRADSGALRALEAAKPAKFFFDSAERSKIKTEFLKLFTDKMPGLIRQADELCNHRFRIFNMFYNPGPEINWHIDILTGKSWPLKFWMDIDFKNSADYGEARFAWELNRHQHLVTLARAYFLSGDERYASEAVDELSSWIKNNPPYKGINWASPLEIALRLISWSWVFEFIKGSKGFSKDFEKEFLRSVYAQADFIKRNMSGYSSANNHLIGEACGLIVAGLAFNGFRDSAGWVNTGKRILCREMAKQVHEDGVIKEQTFHYQGFVMELILLAFAVMAKNKMTVSENASSRFLNMCEFTKNVMDKNGCMPSVGDADDGRAARLSGDEGISVFPWLLAGACILFGRGDFKAQAGAFREEHFWLFGMDGFKKYRALKAWDAGLGSRLFAKGGYAVLRNHSENGNEKVLLMDCGELGYLSTAAHGHADLMSVTLSSYGVELLIDPGTYLYHRGRAWRDYFRGTSAHNTIVINNENQAEIKGPFMWGKRPVPSIEKWESAAGIDCVIASYRKNGAFHRRAVYFDKEQEVWLIRDFLRVKRNSLIEQYFHLAPGSSVRKTASGIAQVENKGVFLYMYIDGRFFTEIKKGEVSPISGWSSPWFGMKAESPVIVNKAVINNEKIFDTFLYVSKEKVDAGNLKEMFAKFKMRKAVS